MQNLVNAQNESKTAPYSPQNAGKVFAQALCTLPPRGSTREFDRLVYARVVGIASEALEGESVKER